MRPLTAFAALLVLAVCTSSNAHELPRTRDPVHATLRNLLGHHAKPIKKIVSCSHNLGPTKCLSALSAWRAERALDAYAKDSTIRFNLTEDVEQFPWIKYSNVTDEQLYTQLCDDTDKLLQHRSLSLDMIPGYKIKLNSEGNGKMKVDVIKNDEMETGRSSMKKMMKAFYKFAPLLVMPGLIMSAVMPFILPGLKMATLFIGWINNMALTGAIFTLLRNNAFNDKYEHKIVYVNSGYENEKYHAASNNEEHIHTDHVGVFYDDSKAHGKTQLQHTLGEEFDAIEEMPAIHVSPEWIKSYTDEKMNTYLGHAQRRDSNIVKH